MEIKKKLIFFFLVFNVSTWNIYVVYAVIKAASLWNYLCLTALGRVTIIMGLLGFHCVHIVIKKFEFWILSNITELVLDFWNTNEYNVFLNTSFSLGF